MKKERITKVIWALIAVSILVQHVRAQCDDLDFPFRQFSTADVSAVVYNTFGIDATAYTARQNPTYDIITCGFTDESGTQTPILTKLQASNGYNALWSYKIVFASNKQCNDVNYSGDGSAAIFVLDNVAAANNKVVHIGRVKDLLTQSATPTIQVWTFTSSDNANAPIFAGHNLSAIEGDHTAYLILRNAPFQTNGLQYVKLNLDTNTVSIHKRITKNVFDSEVISLATGETPITSLFLTGWFKYASAGKTYRSIWVWKADSELLNPSVSFEYTWKEAGWTALINNGADEAAQFFPEHMAYETGSIYVGASLYKSTAFAATTIPVMLFYLSSSSLQLETTGQNFYFLRITNQQLKLRGYNIVESGVMSVFVQATGNLGYYLQVDLSPDAVTRVLRVYQVTFYQAVEAEVGYAFYFRKPDGSQRFFYSGSANQNVCTENESNKNFMYGFINVLDDTLCPCLFDTDITDSYSGSLTEYPVVSDATNTLGFFKSSGFSSIGSTTPTGSTIVLGTATKTNLLDPASNFSYESALCAAENFSSSTINCACSNVEGPTVVSPVLTFASDQMGIQVVSFAKMTMAYATCRDKEPENPDLTCYNANDEQINCLYASVTENGGNYEISIGDASGTYTNANAMTWYARVTAVSAYGAQGSIDFYWVVTYVPAVCEENYSGAETCTDPCLYGYAGTDVCSPCSSTYGDGPNASNGQACLPCDDFYEGADACTPCTTRYMGTLSCNGCWPLSIIYGNCAPCDEGYAESGFGSELCDPCSNLYEGTEECNSCWPNYTGPPEPCTACDYGYAERSIGTGTCTACIAGYDGPYTCSPCDENYLLKYPLDSAECGPCDSGYDGTQTCTPCSDRYTGSLECTACFWNSPEFQTAECSPCLDGYDDWILDQDETPVTCSPCSLGYSGSLSCTACFDDFDGDGDGLCTPCDDGYKTWAKENNVALQDCTPCTPHYSKTEECTQCYPDSPDYNVVKCSGCDAGYQYFARVNKIFKQEACSPCFSNYFGEETCGPCDAGYLGTGKCEACTDRSPQNRYCKDPCSSNYRGSETCLKPYAPTFKDVEVDEAIELTVMKGVKSIYYLPEIDMFLGTDADQDGDGWVLTCRGWFVDQIMSLTISDSSITNNIKVTSKLDGFYNSLCTLRDEKNSKRFGLNLETNYMFNWNVIDFQTNEKGQIDPSKITGSFGGWVPPVEAPKEEPIIIVEDLEEEVQVPEDSVAKVGDFDRFGMMTIKFVNQLKPFDLGTLNDETVEVIVNNVRGVFHRYEDGETPADFWRSSQERQSTRRLDTFSLSDFEYDKSAFIEAEAEWTKRLNFTWYPVDFKDSNTLRLQLDWEFPKNVSLRDFQDSISVNFQNTAMFIEWSQNATLIPNGLQIKAQLPSQLSRESGQQFRKFLKALYIATMVICAVYLLMNLILGTGADHLWTLIHTMQIYTHFLLFDLKWPANCAIMLKQFLEMARLKIIPAVPLVERLFGIKHNEGLTQVFNEAGYDQTNMAHILSYFCSTMIGLIIILVIIFVGSALINWFLKRHTGLPKRVFWQSSHRLLLLGLIELILCPIIYILGRKVLWFSILLVCMCAVFVLYLLVRLIDVLCVRRSQQENPVFYMKNMTFYYILHRKVVGWQRNLANMYYFVFFFRRCCLVAIILCLQKEPAVQLQLCIGLSVLQIAYLGFSKPIVSVWHLAYEIADEILVIFICYLNLTFSNFWPDENVQARYIVGTSVNGVVTFHIIYHLIFMLVEIFATTYRLIRNVLKKNNRVLEIDKKVPVRAEKDLCYPFDKNEFSARDANTVRGLQGWKVRSKRGGKKDPKKAIKSGSKGDVQEIPLGQLITEKELFPYGHPKYVEKGRETEKPHTIDEFSYEGTIAEENSASEEEVIFEERVLLKNDDSEPATMDLNKFAEPQPETLDGLDAPKQDTAPTKPTSSNEEDLSHLNAYRTDSRFGIRKENDAGPVTKKDAEAIDYDVWQTLDPDLFYKTDGGKHFASDIESEDSINQDISTTFALPQVEIVQKPSPTKKQIGLLPQGFRDEIYEAMVAKTRARLEEEKERRKKVKEEEEELEKDLGIDGQLHGGHKFFRAIATSLQRKSQFAAVKAVRNKKGFFDKIQSTRFDVDARAEKDVTSPKSRRKSRSPSPELPLHRHGTMKIARHTVAENTSILKNNLVQDPDSGQIEHIQRESTLGRGSLLVNDKRASYTAGYTAQKKPIRPIGYKQIGERQDFMSGRQNEDGTVLVQTSIEVRRSKEPQGIYLEPVVDPKAKVYSDEAKRLATNMFGKKNPKK